MTGKERALLSALAAGLFLSALTGAMLWGPRNPDIAGRHATHAPIDSYRAGGKGCEPVELSHLRPRGKQLAERESCSKAEHDEQQSQAGLTQATRQADAAEQAAVVSQYQAWSGFWQTFATVWAFIAAGIAAYYAKRAAEETGKGASAGVDAARAAEKAAEAAMKNAQAVMDSERPHLLFNTMILHGVTVEPQLTTAEKLYPGQRALVAELSFKNQGKRHAG